MSMCESPPSLGQGKGKGKGKGKGANSRMVFLFMRWCEHTLCVDQAEDLDINEIVEGCRDRVDQATKVGITDVAEMTELTLLEQACVSFNHGDNHDMLREWEQGEGEQGEGEQDDGEQGEEEEAECDRLAQAPGKGQALYGATSILHAAPTNFDQMQLEELRDVMRRMEDQQRRQARAYTASIGLYKNSSQFTVDFTAAHVDEQALLKRRISNLEESGRSLKSQVTELSRMNRELLLLLHKEHPGISPVTGRVVDEISHPLDLPPLREPTDNQVCAVVRACEQGFKFKDCDMAELVDLLRLDHRPGEGNRSPSERLSPKDAFKMRAFAVDFWNDLAKYRVAFWGVYNYLVGDAHGRRQPHRELVPRDGGNRSSLPYPNSRRVDPPADGSMPHLGKPAGVDLAALERSVAPLSPLSPLSPLGSPSVHRANRSSSTTPSMDRLNLATPPPSVTEAAAAASRSSCLVGGARGRGPRKGSPPLARPVTAPVWRSEAPALPNEDSD